MGKKLRMPNVNIVTISGRITRDLELRYLNSGTQVVTLPMAFSRNYRDKQGQWQQETSFLDVVAWSTTAERCAQNLKKGDPVLVEGSLRTRSFTAKDGKNVKVTEIQASRVHFLEKDDNGQAAYSSDGGQSAAVGEKNFAEPSVDMDDESVPF